MTVSGAGEIQPRLRLCGKVGNRKPLGFNPVRDHPVKVIQLESGAGLSQAGLWETLSIAKVVSVV